MRKLLAECDLPTADLTTNYFKDFLGCGTTENLQGVVGLEVFGSVALLRSLAVVKELRGSGCGKALVAAAEEYAQVKAVCELYLLTTTAKNFFANLGYISKNRDTAPEQIKLARNFLTYAQIMLHLWQKNWWANKTLQRTANPPLRSGLVAAEFGRYA